MTERFADLKKIPREPALRLLALSNMKFNTPIATPTAAPVDQVLAELDRTDRFVDILRLMAAALPVRERIWWGCLAGEDLVPDPSAPPPAPLATAQAWVFKPSEEARKRAWQAAEQAEYDDNTALCATAVAFCDGKLGIGEMASHDAPTGACAMAVFGVNLLSLGDVEGEEFEARKTLLIDRALDIARGGNGRLGTLETALEGDAP